MKQDVSGWPWGNGTSALASSLGAKFEKMKMWCILCLLPLVAVVTQWFFGAFLLRCCAFKSIAPLCQGAIMWGWSLGLRGPFCFCSSCPVDSLEPAPSLSQVMPQVGSSETKRNKQTKTIKLGHLHSCFMFSMAFMHW